MSHPTILLLLSCKAYAHKADIQRRTWLPHLPSSIAYYHVIGDAARCGEYRYRIHEQERIIYTNTADDYLSLPHKLITALQAVHENMTYDYLYKTDDDQIVTDLSFFAEVEQKRTGHSYGGNVLSVETHFSRSCDIHSEVPPHLVLEGTEYCTGRFYFLSREAVGDLLTKRELFVTRIIEDHAVGYLLSPAFNSSPLRLNDRIAVCVMDFAEQYVEKAYFIYTECVNCPEIGINALLSYQTHHSYPVHVYLTQADLEYFQEHGGRVELDFTRIQFELVPSYLTDVYQRDGHLATAMLWESVLQRATRATQKIVHFDSDVIFRGDAVTDIVVGLYSHDLVGPMRCYHRNLNGRDDIRHQSDVVATYCFGWNPTRLPLHAFSTEQWVQMIRGAFCPLPLTILDFFDPVSYLILHHGGTIQWADFTVIGGLNPDGSKDNGYVLNHRMDCGHKIIHFSSVGSGITFEKAQQRGVTIQVPDSYVQHSLRTLAIYRYLLFGVDHPSRLTEEIRSLRPLFQELSSLTFVPVKATVQSSAQ